MDHVAVHKLTQQRQVNRKEICVRRRVAEEPEARRAEMRPMECDADVGGKGHGALYLTLCVDG